METVAYTIVSVAFIVALANIPSWSKSMRLYKQKSRFSCILCGNCCRFRHTPLTTADIDRLNVAGLTGFLSGSAEPSLKRVGGKCVFLENDRCSVHEHRPQVCRSFPFFTCLGVGYAQSASFCPALDELEKK